MHVLLTPSWYPASPGDVVGSFFREQALALRDAGARVGVLAPISLSLRKPSKWHLASDGMRVESDQGVPTYRLASVEWLGRVPLLGPKIWVDNGLLLYRRYVEAHGFPNVVHAHSMLNGALLAKAIKERDGIPYVVTEHSTAYARGRVRGWQLRNASRVATDASARIAVSEPFVQLLERVLGDGPGAWRYVPNMVDERFFSAPLATPPNDGSFEFCNVGFLTPKKGQAALIRAFAEAFANDRRVTLAIAGDGDMRRALEDYARSCGVGDRVRFLGRVSRQGVVELMRSSAAFVLSSEVETFGVVAAEALAVGLPVVATRSGGPESIVRECDGLLVSNGDHAALVNALRYMRENRSSYSPARLRQGCMDRYSGSAVSAALMNIYTTLTSSGRDAR